MVENINDIALSIFNLFSNDYNNKFHIREMAKRINKSHVALLPYLSYFEKNKILLSETKGKNKIFRLNSNNSIAKEFLILSEKKQTIDFVNKDTFLKEIYNRIIHLDGCFIIVNYNKSSQFILHIGKTPINQIKDLRIKVLTGNIDVFRGQLSKNSQMIKDFLIDHIILSNHELLIDELWKNYAKTSVFRKPF